jgi:site-specific DNA recombinase
MLSIMLGQSKFYVDHLSETFLGGIRQTVKSGCFPNWAPIGYVNDRTARRIVIDPVKGPLVRKAFELYGTGRYTLRQVTDTVNALGTIGKGRGPPNAGNYQYILKNLAYYGLLTYQ